MHREAYFFLLVICNCVIFMNAQVNDTIIPKCLGNFVLNVTQNRTYCQKDVSGKYRQATEVSFVS